MRLKYLWGQTGTQLKSELKDGLVEFGLDPTKWEIRPAGGLRHHGTRVTTTKVELQHREEKALTLWGRIKIVNHEGELKGHWLRLEIPGF